MSKLKNLGYDRWLQYKQPLQKSGLCCFSFVSYLEKCVTQIYRALYGDRDINMVAVTKQKHLLLSFAIEMEILTLEL